MQFAVLFFSALTFLSAQPSDSIPDSNPTDLDKSVDPCVDFYRYSCGTWLAKNPIPPDQSSWSRFDELQERNREILRGILERASVNDPKRSANEQKIGDYYAACMDEKAIDAKGTAPIKPDLDRIAAVGNLAALTDEIAHLHAIGVSVLFDFGSGPDFKNSSQNIAQADQGSLGLPDRDYYLKQDPESQKLRSQYLAHVKKVFELIGDSEPIASKRADVVMRMETALAKASLDRVSRRDPSNIYHKMNLQELAALTPSFAWPKYLRDVDAPPVNAVNVAVPDFFKQVQSMLGATSLDDWKTYLTWQLARAQSPLLPTSFVEENFAFYGKILTGAKELRPRWKRCVTLVNGQLGEALGQLYVDRTFGAEGKQKTLNMVQAIETALARDIAELTWMTPETKKYALEKLHAVANKIGYPDKWRDYSTVKIIRGDAIGNADRASEFEFHRQVAKIGKPVDRMEWFMTPPTVNAYYDPPMNDINFPAGILQPPFFDSKRDDATNFGAIGAVIGHELTHGFDDEGRKFDAKGNLLDWWTPRDAREFEARASCFVQQYSDYTAVDDIKLNGKLTLGENTADNGGVRLAYMALMDRLAAGAGDAQGKIGGFSPEQRLFLGYGQIWCMRRTPESARMRAVVDPHSPGSYRVNGVLSNMPEFQKAFGCKVGQPMVRVKQCRVW